MNENGDAPPPTNPPPPARPPRRPRYRGTHPRGFAEKYKERAPELYPDEFAKVVASGKTPAGSHRPVMVAEVMTALALRPGESGVDGTLGGGGHAAEILRRIAPGGRLYALDVDPVERPRTEARLRALGHGEDSLVVRAMNFAGLPRLVDERRGEGAGPFDFVLCDLGVSSMQLDDPARGFSYKRDAPLDLRMNPGRGSPASALLARLPAAKLASILEANGDEPRAREIAAAVVAARDAAFPASTGALAELVRSVLGPAPAGARAEAARERLEKETLARVFQALRIEVNDEFAALDALLAALPSCLGAGGRAVLLSFHSGEDRRVKKAFRAGLEAGLWAEISDGVVRPSPGEVGGNPRSAPAKLRWARRP